MIKDRALIEEAHKNSAAILEEYLSQGQNVVYITLGDPTVYCTFSNLQHILMRQMPVSASGERHAVRDLLPRQIIRNTQLAEIGRHTDLLDERLQRVKALGGDLQLALARGVDTPDALGELCELEG